MPDAEAAAGRLLENQKGIGGAISPYYGTPAANALTDLLRQHILIAVDLVEAAKASDTEAFALADAKWTANAEENRAPRCPSSESCSPPMEACTHSPRSALPDFWPWCSRPTAARRFVPTRSA